MLVMSMRFTKLNYCQYLLSSQINYTITNLAEHLEQITHDAINYYLKREKLTPRLLSENVKDIIERDANGYIIFDDSVLDKRYSQEIEMVRRQYSGNEHGAFKGIGVVSCVYVNPKVKKFWVIDYRIFNPDVDGKTKIDHVKDMLSNLVYQMLVWVRLKNLAYQTGQTIYQIKHNLLSNYLIQQLKRPSIPMCLV
jgi:hypothetical protein